jgi:ubiquinone/menaquinone biosynthesis C-methylase UbiE
MKNKDVKGWFGKNAEVYSKQSYEYAQKCRTKFIRKNIKNIGGLILDVGVGSGKLTSKYSNSKDDNIIGLDISLNMLKEAKKNLNVIPLVKADGEFLPFRDNSFDAIICSELLYYLEKPEMFIQESKRVLKKNGTLLIISNNQFWFFLNKIRQKLKIGPEKDIARRFFYPLEIKSLLARNEFREIKSEGFCVVPFRYFRTLDKTFLSKFGFIHGFIAIKRE